MKYAIVGLSTGATGTWILHRAAEMGDGHALVAGSVFICTALFILVRIE